MKKFQCSVCGSDLYFENSVCMTCGSALGYSRATHEIVAVNDEGAYVDGEGYVWWVCRNLQLSGCTWLTELAGDQCSSCDMTRVRPNDADLTGLEEFPPAERAKRHMLVELDRLGIAVVDRERDPVNGLCFDLLSSVQDGVTIGHANGVITIDLAESDDAYRAKVREKLDEPYRTMLGHFRHEVGHYIQWQHVRSDAQVAQYRDLFGDDTIDYQAAIDRHYRDGAPANWRESYISGYATMHPYEDFAETWAHLMHISDTIDTGVAFGLVSKEQVAATGSFVGMVTDVWVPLSIALNNINRSMGKADLYPFVLARKVLDKLGFAASLVPGSTVTTL